MKSAFIILVLGLLTLGIAAETTRVIVFEFAVEGCPQNVGKEAASYTATAFAYMDGYEAVDPAIVQKLCDNEKVESYDVDAATATKLGLSQHTAGADLAVLGKVEKDGSEYKVTIQYVNIAQGAVIAEYSRSGTGIYSLSRSIDKLVGLLE